MAAIDLANKTSNVIDPAGNFAAITPHASNELLFRTRAVFVGGAGNVVAVSADGTEVTFTGVLAGTVLPIRTVRIDDTSTATAMVALW
ncbi:hypothetical protein G9X67_34845 [Rhizobium sp. WYCCWR 11152]|uniref:spike base protein, RCAP_Rcc01079 family n=1 Tax=Rhizobium sp. WYCCWR 11152 TaxID=2692316 RepID=UPI00149289E4|nr:hypothetical protein [Rhizobium sp. WYCCWR 11152]NNU70432.1 hypothetical protein [Rhizobium sp. WYCCWR 11152]